MVVESLLAQVVGCSGVVIATALSREFRAQIKSGGGTLASVAAVSGGGYDAETGILQFLYKVTGAGTRGLATLRRTNGLKGLGHSRMSPSGPG